MDITEQKNKDILYAFNAVASSFFAPITLKIV